jgi:hypothetical protein
MTRFDLDDAKIPDDTILLFGIQYGGSTSAKVYTFAALKAGGRWFFTGSGPRDAGWAAVQRWLQGSGRVVAWVKVATGMDTLWQNDKAEAQLQEIRDEEAAEADLRPLPVPSWRDTWPDPDARPSY